MPERCTISFPGTPFDPLEIERGTRLASKLTAVNSPVLFGCRSGICGTCLVEIEEGCESLPPPDPDELEALDLFAPGNPKARFACQLEPTENLSIRKIGS